MQATATQNQDGTWRIEVDGKVVRKASRKLFENVYTFRSADGYPNHKLSNDSQMRRSYGEPEVTPITTVK